jgi:hypothetical protein
VSYDPIRYRGRNVVERCIGWLKECRVELAIIERYLRLLTKPAAST